MAESTAIGTTDREQERHRQGQQTNSSLKIFLNRHEHFVDFFCATTLICVCLIVLLPRVHDSFIEQTAANHTHEDSTLLDSTFTSAVSNETVDSDSQVSVPMVLANFNGSTNANTATLTPFVEEQDHSPNHDHDHHHHHGFPAGEFLVCIGFFVFYCVGFTLEGSPVEGLERDAVSRQSRRAILRRQSTATTCCSSTKCPPIPPYAGHQSQVIESNQLISSGGQLVSELTLLAPRTSLRNPDDDCLMLLNPHHQHHTHNKHHDTAQLTTSMSVGNVESGQALYGSIGGRDDQLVQRRHQTSASDIANISKNTAISKPKATIIVDEIRITSEPSEVYVSLSWPRSLKMLLISMILAAFLVFFDMKLHGWLTAIRVFRACSTGALLYVAFFIMLPRDRVGCNSCQEEEN